jgi:hypothetical protein
MTPEDPLEPLDAVEVGDTTIVIDRRRPVAALVSGSGTRFVTWPDAALPAGAPTATVVPAGDGAWVVYAEEAFTRLPTCTAVRVDVGGTAWSVDLGQRAVVGVEAEAIWGGDPRDPATWDGADRDADPVTEAPDIDSLPQDESLDPFWPEGDDDDSLDDDAVDDEDSADDAVTFVGTLPVGLVIEGGPQPEWFVAFDSEDDTELPPSGPPPIPVPTPPTELVRFDADGSHTIVVDHFADGVARDGDVLRIRVHPTGPRWVPDDTGWGGQDVVYEPVVVDVDCSAGLPDRVDIESLPTTPGTPDDPWFRSVFDRTADEDDLEDEYEAVQARVGAWSGRIDLEGVAGAQWVLAAPDEDAISAAVDRVRAMFASLDAPSAMWIRVTDAWSRRPSDYRNVAVVTEGTWPHTEVVVSFEHRSVRDLRLRRRYRVFDDSGRPIEHEYVTVYLEEDIATGDIPPRTEARDGVLDI